MIDQMRCLDRNSSDNGTRDSDRQKREEVDDHVDQRADAAVHEHPRHARPERDELERDRDAVQHEHGHARDAQGVQSVVDFLRPVEIRQVDVDTALVELGLQVLARVEVVHGRLVRAIGHVPGDVALGDGGVGHGSRRVEAFAVVEDVRGVEVVYTECSGGVVQAVLQLGLDAVGDFVPEVSEGVVGVGGFGRVEDVVPDLRGVELG